MFTFFYFISPAEKVCLRILGYRSAVVGPPLYNASGEFFLGDREGRYVVQIFQWLRGVSKVRKKLLGSWFCSVVTQVILWESTMKEG